MVDLLFNEKTQESTFAVYDATQLRRSAGLSVGTRVMLCTLISIRLVACLLVCVCVRMYVCT